MPVGLLGIQKKTPGELHLSPGGERIEKILNPMFNKYIDSLSKDLNDKTTGLPFSSNVFQPVSTQCADLKKIPYRFIENSNQFSWRTFPQIGT